jgi:magnesium transporter
LPYCEPIIKSLQRSVAYLLPGRVPCRNISKMYVENQSVVATAATVFSPSTFIRDITLQAGVTIAKDGDSQLQRWSSFIGIITAIIGNIIISIALNVQRYAHIRLHKERSERRERSKNLASILKNGYGTTTPGGNGVHRESIEDEERDPLMQSYHSADSQSTTCLEEQSIREKSYLKSPYWWAGILLMTIGETGNFLAYGFAPASIVSPLGVVALISNCVIAPIMLKEQFRWRDFWGVVVSIGGAVTVVLSAKHQERKLGPHEVLGAITTTAFEVYMGITVFLIIALMWSSPLYGSRTILVDLGLAGLFGKALRWSLGDLC